MAVRTPVKLDGSGNIVAMSAGDILNIINEAVRQYAASPSVDLSVVVSGGSLGSLSDTRYQAGASASGAAAFPLEAATAEPSQITVNYTKVDAVTESLTAPIDTNNRLYPLYLTATNQLQAMSLTDFYDTFISPAIDLLVTAGQTTAQAGTYTIHTATTLSGATLVSATPIFTDTVANTAAYTSGGIPEVQDQPLTVTNYYLFIINAASVGTIPAPVYIRSDGHIQEFSAATLGQRLQDAIRYYATQAGSKITYSIGTSALNSRGSGIVNTDHTGVTGTYAQRMINTNDYRAQEFPNGTLATISTNYLQCART